MKLPGRSPTGAVMTPRETPARPLLTVVVPVYNGGEDIVANVETIRSVIAAGLRDEELELVVVSDGSIDGTDERLLEARADAGIRVIHYDRNLGKGYAVKVGALAAEGEWVALVDADLDLDPAAIPDYLDLARRESLDFAIGSKRHPRSVVHYPRSRRIASWCYQQLNRALFRLDVRDTQVGLKVFRRDVVDGVMPLLLVKQFAFDLELLAVARALGYGRVRELPVRLDYRFTGSGVRSGAVGRALVDTLAIFYRLRILHTYQRKRRLLGEGGTRRRELPSVAVIGDPDAVVRLDYPRIEAIDRGERDEAVRTARAEVLAVLEEGARPAGNWVSATVPYLRAHDVAAVVCPVLAPASSALRVRAAGAVLESWLGGGSRRFRHLPGNVHVTRDHPAESVVARRDDYVAALDASVDDERLVAWLAERGRKTVYTPDTSVASAPEPLFGPHLRGTLRHARARGVAARRSRGASTSTATALSLAPLALASLGGVLIVSGSSARQAGLWLVGAYGVTVAGSAALAGLRFRSLGVGLLAAPALVATQAAYVAGFADGVARGR